MNAPHHCPRHFLLLIYFLLLMLLGQEVSLGSFRKIDYKDNPDILSPKNALEKNLPKLNAQASMSMKLDLTPWADGHWRLQDGITAARYADMSFRVKSGWQDRRKYVVEHPVAEILKEKDPKKRAKHLDKLSPAEKYDLIVGDSQGTLAKSQWEEGQRYADQGTLAKWMGICEGSAAASALYPEPKHSVDLNIANGDMVRFHVLDIKALASLLWSSFNTDIPIAGSRCPTSAPKKDRAGLIIDDDCFNANPATLHIALLNFVGVRKVPFFMNRVMNTEVWNVPVTGYELRYFNVERGNVTKDFASAVIPLGSYKSDSAKSYRAPEAASIVGVELKVQVATGGTSSRDESASTSTTSLSYRYDLELDSAGQIVGGEWWSDSHPDFIWAVDPQYEPRSYGEVTLGDNPVWDGQTVPVDWLGAIQQSSRRSQPMRLIVRKLIELSQ